MKFHVVLLLLLLALVLFAYIKFSIEIILSDNDRFQGLQIRFGLLWHHFEHSFDYTDPRLNLWEALAADYWNAMSKRNEKWSWAQFKQIFKIGPQLQTWSDLSPIMKKMLDYIVIEKISWQSRIGGSNAMWSALYAGILWALKGLGITFLARNSHLRQVQLMVQPDYISAELVSEFACILKIRIVHIIIIAIYLTVWKVRWWINGFTANTREQPSY